jgi:hypothetical protein
MAMAELKTLTPAVTSEWCGVVGAHCVYYIHDMGRLVADMAEGSTPTYVRHGAGNLAPLGTPTCTEARQQIGPG